MISGDAIAENGQHTSGTNIRERCWHLRHIRQKSAVA